MADAHGCRSPMEINIRVDPAKDDGIDEPQFVYRYAVGALMYSATSARPEVAFARLMRYLMMTIDNGIFDKRPDSPQTRLV
ncbi:hypothetical protein PHMEG_0009720 [Phytophthora megakarya]|uniref:Uncharacterized protein n=1 Tax=Phytophthora megakarya TaxID=4795 RepID=A0A225WFI8_9STRA|nr:hypothetical protein PHMEG_0009720 [Phytophthora megakarya]